MRTPLAGLAFAALLATSLTAAARADFGAESPAKDAQQLADRAMRSGDHKTLPFAIVDKTKARVYARPGRGSA